jgi:hypothetical protein
MKTQRNAGMLLTDTNELFDVDERDAVGGRSVCETVTPERGGDQGDVIGLELFLVFAQRYPIDLLIGDGFMARRAIWLQN